MTSYGPITDVWENVKKDYFEGAMSLREIAKKWSVGYDNLVNRIYRGNRPWKAEKAKIDGEIQSYAIEQSQRHLTKTYQETLTTITRINKEINKGLDEGIYEKKDLPTVGFKLAKMLQMIHPILRLETNRSTQNVDVKAPPSITESIQDLSKKGLIDKNLLEDVEIIEDDPKI